jgi:glutaminyl-peptide cyclotransferase
VKIIAVYTRILTLRAFPLAVLLLAACQRDAPLPEAPQFDENRAWNYLGTQVTFGPRIAGHEPHTRQLAWMRDQLGFTADTVVVQPFQHLAGNDRPRNFANVVASWRPELKDRVLLVAHWDSRVFASRDPDPSKRIYPVPGANDGASGTAVLMELAQLFRQQAPSIGVDILLADGSDHGRDSTLTALGTRHYLSTLPAGVRPRFAVFVDRVADLQLQLPREPRSTPAVVDKIWGMAARMGRDSLWVSTPGPQIPGDHIPLLEAGIPTAAVVDPEFGPQNRFWRTRSDHISNTTRASLREVGEVLANVVYAETPTP